MGCRFFRLYWKRLKLAGAFCLGMFLVPVHTGAAERGHGPSLRKAIFGLFLHDREPASDKHEGGVDPNWEIQLRRPN